MYHIVFNCNDNYVKYTAVLIQNIINYVDKNKAFGEISEDVIYTGGGVNATPLMKNALTLLTKANATTLI
ncbi:hypothetical protein DCO60_04870 [Helicobacter saguini]|uniref:hypothetical protein n=1 Tax=Helicobacter saguini TaxID=1548018 RepID=UPI001327DC34|nr:hypothetical protein [Helicobacter saguini]MWV61787.1 hypothetical protein [Helicobacter saguini]